MLQLKQKTKNERKRLITTNIIANSPIKEAKTWVCGLNSLDWDAYKLKQAIKIVITTIIVSLSNLTAL